MYLNSLPKIVDRAKKRMGRGLGSGKGKTGGRGMKGAKARGKIPASFTGGGLSLYRKLPFKRGWGNRKVSAKPVVVKTSQLNNLKPKSVVNIESLVENKLVDPKKAALYGVKILNNQPLKIALTIKLPVSQSVKAQVEKVGGEVVG